MKTFIDFHDMKMKVAVIELLEKAEKFQLGTRGMCTVIDNCNWGKHRSLMFAYAQTNSEGDAYVKTATFAY